VQNRQRKRRCFARSRLGTAENIAPGKGVGNRLFLNGSGGGIALRGNGTEDRLSEPEIGKLHSVNLFG
jgi:hypothetical protein